MSKVTYLFGAGASCNCLPLVKDIPAAIDEFRQQIVHLQIDNPDEKFKYVSDHTINEGRNLLLQGCMKLHEMVKAHASIDTYAKKLLITGKMEEYRALKVILSFLFIYLQSEKRVDYRYDSFFASILGNDSTDFNGNIKIVSWNYDFQFEKAYSQFSQSNRLSDNQSLLNVIPDGIRPEHYKDRFSIFKINGTTSFINVTNAGIPMYPIEKFEPYSKTELLRTCIYFYLISVIRKDIIINSRINFAWESYPVTDENNIINTAKKAIANSDAIVVIGYSFPFFNRLIDRDLILSAYAGRDLKIYIQDTYPENIIPKLSSVLPKSFPKENIIPIEALLPDEGSDTKDQFFLPPEL